MLITAVPGALLWPAALVTWGPGGASAQHRHHCVQLVMALADTVRIRDASGGPWTACSAALIRPDAAHEVDARAVPVLIAYVEAESEFGAALMERTTGAVSIIPPAEVQRWRSLLQPSGAPSPDAVQRWVGTELLRRRRPLRVHPRARRVLEYVREKLDAGTDLSLAHLAGVAGLSPSRLMHVFTASTGVALRPYILWLRLQCAAGELVRGASVMKAAHAAGFSDAAHMSRTFRRMLGTTPSEMVRRGTRTPAVSLE